jgi:hypothetical protein
VHSGLRTPLRCPLLVSEAMTTGGISTGCRDLPACRCSSHGSAGSRPDRKYTNTLLASFAKSIAIAAWILPVFVFNVLSRKSWDIETTRAPLLAGERRKSNSGTFSSYKLSGRGRGSPRNGSLKGGTQYHYRQNASQPLLLPGYL